MGVSACLLGDPVRWDGGHKREPALLKGWGAGIEWVPVCPEVEIGLGVPREPIRWEQRGATLRLMGRDSGADHTDSLARWGAKWLLELHTLAICGFVLKKGSPSCGLVGVPVHDSRGQVVGDCRGGFAEALHRHAHGLPLEDEERLRDPGNRARFLESARAYANLRPRLR